MSKSLISRNIVIDGQRTSFRLEPEMWSALEYICQQEKISLHTLCSWINKYRPRPNRTSAIRAFIVSYLYAQIDANAGASREEEEPKLERMSPVLSDVLKNVA